ncbi:MAG TPA: addiction module protein [Polyangia bacterium]|nr:addiction module protein [Polyangia bacterium]
MAARNLLAQALELSPKERARIAHELIVSLDEESPEDPGTVAKAWGEELARRVQDLKSGKVKAVPWSIVKRDLDRTLRAVRARKRRTRTR